MKRIPPTGPFAAPLPKTAEDNVNEPMAVARDKQQTHGESFLATSAPLDAYDDEVARRYKQVPAREMMAKSGEMTIRMQAPPGFSAPDERGFAHLEDEE